MDNSVDDGGAALFTDDYEHDVAIYNDFDSDKTVDFIKTNGNIWFPASDVVELLGTNTNETGNTGRSLKRLDHPDIIKVKDTSFRFTDGRRNRGSFISPRAIMVFADGKTKNFNPIKANAFVAWMEDELLEGLDASHWSPAKREIELLEPVFRKITYEKPEDKPELDVLRPVGRYLPLINMSPLRPDEIEFCLCEDERNGLGRCWCRRKGGIRTYMQQQIEVAGEPDCVIDDHDTFVVTTEIVTVSRIRTLNVTISSSPLRTSSSTSCSTS
ncbi:hypothetical protein ROLI_010560 [Roseobacter fucihabitans]|uniref:Bro-N domain-containing protein n=1 Tax=Roseobacter fucihabitans TaxID=1537242 RepID=A0ABZ2BSY7_9RHOB|nr:hypothetical protein [Roseobacter litoralis]MBC6965318.1 hypothetical protein [Roseobacter litoralis]MBC6965516.1 hypothetical protein [Roseobacter litoralis]